MYVVAEGQIWVAAFPWREKDEMEMEMEMKMFALHRIGLDLVSGRWWGLGLGKGGRGFMRCDLVLCYGVLCCAV
jgi:hypothetical protein